MSKIETFFSNMWKDYSSITPSAEKIRSLFESRGEDVINDHVALRTFKSNKLGKHQLAKHFLELGYKEAGDYEFKEKKLLANHYESPEPNAPKVFISELLVDQLSDSSQKIIHQLLEQCPNDISDEASFLYSGKPWELSSKDYDLLLEESEYAAWMSAWGYHANHFTVSVNHLKSLSSLEEVNELLKEQGYKLNTTGGEIKGTPKVLLEQSSTLADFHTVGFTDCKKEIPSCFYEFARRYPTSSGELYSGFVAANADKIFDSTNVK